MKVLIIAEQCNPEWASVPLVAWNYFRELSKFVDVTLVTLVVQKSAERIDRREVSSETGIGCKGHFMRC